MRLPIRRHSIAFIAVLLSVFSLFAGPTGQSPLIRAASAEEKYGPKQLEFFENNIRPVLVKRCYQCHSKDSKSIKGGLLVDSREAIRRGGESGHAVVPGDIEESLIIGALRHETFEMPKEKLPENVIVNFEKWIRMGAPDPREGPAPVVSSMDIEEGRKHWSYQEPKKAAPPKVKDKAWPRSDVDRFLLAKMEAAGVTPVADADKATLLRRTSFDLLGLPPTPKEINAFLADESPDAFKTVVDRMLASPQFGERWGRHWLDVARYAESTGQTRNYPLNSAWRYRSWVIDAVNADMPYDQFITEQLAGDLIAKNVDDPKEKDRLNIATGYLAIGTVNLNERDPRTYQMDVVGEQIDVVSRSIMGLTVGCARCHDHKFDPIPTKDYYALAGIFRSSDHLNGYRNRQGGGNSKLVGDRLYQLAHVEGEDRAKDAASDAARTANLQKLRKGYQDLQNKLRSLTVARAKIANNKKLSEDDKKSQLKKIDKQLIEVRPKLTRATNLFRNQSVGGSSNVTSAIAVRDSQKLDDCPLHIRGDVASLGPVIPRGFLQAVRSPAEEIPADASGREELAAWLVSGQHPLTARVIVNRVWQHLFGAGIVTTSDNFGVSGMKPSHQELLDHLAVKFVDEGWSLKQLIRELTLTRAYQLAVEHTPKNDHKDPDNVLLWRANRKRLEIEALRDSLLVVSGLINLTPPESSPIAKMKAGEIGRAAMQFNAGQFRHRTLYMPVIRGVSAHLFSTFDFPEPSEVKGTRDSTIVSTQALFLMNNQAIVGVSRAVAGKVLQTDNPMNDRQRTRQLYLRLFGRQPTEDQIDRTVEFVEEFTQGKTDGQTRFRAWGEVAHAMIASAEFRYIN